MLFNWFSYCGLSDVNCEGSAPLCLPLEGSGDISLFPLRPPVCPNSRMDPCKKSFCGFSMDSYQYWAGRVYGCVCVFYDGNSRRLNRKWFYGEAGNRTCDPWFKFPKFLKPPPSPRTLIVSSGLSFLKINYGINLICI